MPEGTNYTCPMHPDIREVGPHRYDAPVIDGTVLTLPIVVVEMGFHFSGLAHHARYTALDWLQMILATAVVLWAGWPFFVRGWQSLVSRNLKSLPYRDRDRCDLRVVAICHGVSGRVPRSGGRGSPWPTNGGRTLGSRSRQLWS